MVRVKGDTRSLDIRSFFCLPRQHPVGETLTRAGATWEGQRVIVLVYLLLALIAAGWIYLAVDAAGIWGALASVAVFVAILAAVAH